MAAAQAILDNLEVMALTPGLGEISADNFYIADSSGLTPNPTELNAYLWNKVIYTKYMEEFPVLKENYEEYSNPDKVKERIQLQYNFDKDAYWQKFKSKHVVDDMPETVVS